MNSTEFVLKLRELRYDGKKLPEDITIDGFLHLNHYDSLKSLPDGLKVKQSAYMHGCSTLKALPMNGHRALLRTEGCCILVCGDPSTGRVYYMEVPPKTKTCQEADQYLNRGLDQKRQVGRT